MAEPVTLAQALALATQGLVVVTTALVLVELARRRDRELAEIALMFASLGPAALVGIGRVVGVTHPWLDAAATLAVLAHPYLMVRVVKQLRPVATWVEWPTLAGMLVSWAVAIGFLGLADATPSAAALVVIAYFLYGETYAAIALVAGALASAGVARRRLVFAASGTALLGILILLAGASLALPEARPALTLLLGPLGFAAVLGFYLGFAPPRWLRRSWQLDEVERFLTRTTARGAHERAQSALTLLQEAAMRLTGATASAIATPQDGHWRVELKGEEGEPVEVFEAPRVAGGSFGRGLRSRQHLVLDARRDTTPVVRALASRTAARELVVVPVGTKERTWRLLAIPLERASLFLDEGVQVLKILADQTAVALDVQAIAREQEEIRMREARVATEELRRQNVAMQEATRLKSEFLANMSHELRTPLNGIIGFAELMASGKVGAVNAAHEEFVDDIVTSARHLLQLINDVLDLAKVEAGRMEFRPERLDLSRALEESLVVVRPLAQRKDIHLHLETDEGVGEVELDPVRFRQIAYNFVSNAIKFTPDGGRVSVRLGAEGDDRIRLEVEDTGVGISGEDIPRLFHEFQQLDAGTAKHHQGTGLGLALVRRLVEAQGGEVGVRSEPGKGSVFHAVLPRRPHAVAVAKARDAPFTTGARVLVVDDEERDREGIAAELRAQGYDVDAAATGAQALDLIARRPYDAATIDLVLPDLHGYDLIQALRERAGGSRVAVLIVTRLSSDQVHAAYPVDGIFQKPVDPAALREALQKLGARPARERPVLVVDDDATARRLVEAHLGAMGYRAVLAADGLQALDAVKRDPPALIVLDLVMPRMDGFAFLDAYRRDGGAAPVLVWTSKDLTPDEAARLEGNVQIIAYKAEGGSFALANRLEEALTRR